ncbi:monocarboxylate transporter 13-like [Pecten maximus]|uniref:monocarboxylate transporter 13-like n=1 Tax=Pecten maximus TaxID=6579 RepID=UPI001458B7F9|nr:monocarboxylate transporter 13-like [Pecten maximus]
MSLIGMRTTDNAGPENHEEEEGEKEEEEEEEGDYSHLPIDHGWAFVIVFGCFGVCALVVGTLKSFGVILVELSRRFNVPSSVLIGPQCLAGFFHLCLGPVANALSERYSHRLVVFVGGLLATIGLVSTSFVQSVPAFYVTYGVMSGVGLGLCLSPSLTFQGFHFRKRRALANGLSVSGSGAGSFALPPIIRFLINYYGLGGCLLLLGAFMFHTCVFCSFFRPPSYWMLFNRAGGKTDDMTRHEKHIQVDKDKIRPLLENDSDFHIIDSKSKALVRCSSDPDEKCGENQRDSLYSQVSLHPDHFFRKHLFELKLKEGSQHLSTSSLPCMEVKQTRSDTRSRSASVTQRNQRVTSKEQKQSLLFMSLESLPSRHDSALLHTNKHSCNRHTTVTLSEEGHNANKKPMLDWSLLKNPTYIVFVFVLFTGVMGQHSLYNILPSVANERGISDEQGAIVVSVLGATDLIGRVLFGWLADFGFVKRQTMYQINLTVFALIGFIVPHVTSFIGLCVVVMFLGIFTGGYTGIQLAVLSDKFGPEKLSSSWGFAAFFVSLALLINPVLSGIIRDVTGSWIGAVTLGASVATFGSGILVVENLVIRMRR